MEISRRLGLDKYFCLFVYPHIEKSVLLLSSSLVEGSGLLQWLQN